MTAHPHPTAGPVPPWRPSARFAAEDRTAGGHVGAAPSERGRILVVEDDYFVGIQIEDSLTAAGHTVVGPAITADEAIALAERQRPDLVLMDIRLAGARDGVFAATEIRRRTGIRCVFASAHSDEATRRRAAVAEPLGFVFKPFLPDAVAAAVAAALAILRHPPG